jgi:hypothetical protein
MGAGLRVRTGIIVPSRPGIGSEAQQLRRLEHAAARHGLRHFDCPACSGAGSSAGVSCDSCSGHGLLFKAGDMKPCGPDCPLHEINPV